MGEFLKKYGGKILTGGVVATWFAGMGAAITSIIRGDKRQIKYYEKQDKIQEEQLTYWRNLNEKES